MPTPSDAWKSDLPTVAAAIVKCEVNFVVVILVPVVIVLIVVDSNEYINIVEVAVCKFFFLIASHLVHSVFLDITQSSP